MAQQVKNPLARQETQQMRDQTQIPGLGRSPGEGNGTPLQYSCLGNPMTEEPTGHGVAKESDMTEQLSTAHSTEKLNS